MLETRFPIRLSKAQKAMLRTVARAEGRSSASWVRRQIVLGYAELAKRQAQDKERAK